MGINEIYDLLKKYREHRCTPEEEERIARWYEQFDDEVENLPEVPEGKLEQLWFFIKRKIYVPWTCGTRPRTGSLQQRQREP